MKRHVFTILLLGVFSSSFAQKIGDVQLSIGFNGDFGSTKQTVKVTAYDYVSSENIDVLYSPKASFDCSLGCFVQDNIKVALNFGYGTQIENNDVLKNSTNLFVIGPSLGFYKELTDRFYYTPEVGMALMLGKYIADQSSNLSLSLPVNGYLYSIAPLSFEFRVTDRIALSASFFSLNYANEKITYDDINTEVSTGMFQFSGDSSISLIFYL